MKTTTNTAPAKDWIATSVAFSERSVFYITGTIAATGEAFFWHVSPKYTDGSRFDFSNAVIADNCRDYFMKTLGAT